MSKNFYKLFQVEDFNDKYNFIIYIENMYRINSTKGDDFPEKPSISKKLIQ